MPHRQIAGIAEQMRIDAADIAERKALLGLTEADMGELRIFAPAASEIADRVIAAFYDRQLRTPQLRRIIGDKETLSRLSDAMRRYVEELFGGDYGADYVNTRLRVGRVHARIGVEPKYYVSSMLLLRDLINGHLMSTGLIEAPPKSLEKLMQFDLQLVFDTYVFTLLEEVRAARQNRSGMGGRVGHDVRMEHFRLTPGDDQTDKDEAYAWAKVEARNLSEAPTREAVER